MVEILNADYRSIKPACTALMEGKLIAFPTETVYGIGSMYGNEKSKDLLGKLKGRDQDKPFQILIPNFSYASKYATWDNPKVNKLMHAFWPGPMTLVLPAITEGTCGLRIPDNKWLRVLMLEIGCGLIATSANISGEEAATSAEDINENIGQDLELIIDGGDAQIGESSSVVSINTEGDLEIFRQGAILEEDINDIFYN